MLGLTACPETSAPRDFGVKPATLTPDWEGDWSELGSPDESGHFAIKQADQGLLSISTVDKDKKEQVFEAVVRQASAEKNSKLFFVTWFDKPGDKLGSVNLMAKGDADRFYIWHPRHEAIAAAVTAGRLKGKVTKEPNSSDPHTELEAVDSNYSTLTAPEFWDWTAPAGYFKHKGK